MIRRLLVFFALLAALSGCASSSSRTFNQVSVLDALLAGEYEGMITCSQLLEYGDTGLGTFNALNGEMIVLDGVVYQALVDGTVVRPSPEVTVPFAAVCNFPDSEEILIPPSLNYDGFKSWLDNSLDSLNVPWAVKAPGRFKRMKVRSVPRQDKPYPPLAEVAKHQAVFELEDISGTIVGFRLPAYVKGVNVPGYHLHFISDDRSKGGHILDFEVGEAKVKTAQGDSMFILCPPGASKVDFNQDRQAQMEAVER